MKKVLALGDSFTYGEELENREENCWIHIVARELGVELKNAARPGCSNDYMIKRLMREVLGGQFQPNLVIIAWTSVSRIEEADGEMGVWDSWPGRELVGKNKGSFREDRIKYRTMHNNENWENRRWLRQVLLVQDFCRARNIDFRFVNAFHNQTISKKYSHAPRYIQDNLVTNKFYGWDDSTGMVEWCCNPETNTMTDQMPRGHPGYESHKMIAEKFLEYHRLSGSNI
jgi:hypothetical protein